MVPSGNQHAIQVKDTINAKQKKDAKKKKKKKRKKAQKD